MAEAEASSVPNGPNGDKEGSTPSKFRPGDLLALRGRLDERIQRGYLGSELGAEGRNVTCVGL